MVALRFFQLEFRDNVVEYYFLPARRDVRLTVRFGDVLVHYKQFMEGNFCWETDPVLFSTLVEAEHYVLQGMVRPSVNPDTMISTVGGLQTPEVRQEIATYLVV